MSIPGRLTRIYDDAKQNRWYYYFAVFCRITLALTFLISGLVKIRGERFASGLSANNPLGHYFEALYDTGYYYTFIGISQVAIALLLLIPKTALLGVLLYFPVILNICILTYAVRFEGTRATTFMLLANLYLLVWDFDRIKHVFSLKQVNVKANPATGKSSQKFPFMFFGLVIASILAVIVFNLFLYDIRPGNSPDECLNGCPGNRDPKACEEFCDCIYNKGKSLNDCLGEYHRASR
jgi:uncharacterized membrane protein YphA (DoxX/SURF4 family)